MRGKRGKGVSKRPCTNPISEGEGYIISCMLCDYECHDTICGTHTRTHASDF